jgi:hypothetical protein
MDLNIIQHPKLRSALMNGLNHIPLRPMEYNEATKVTIDALRQTYSILNLQAHGLILKRAIEFVEQQCLERLQAASKVNQFGFKNSGPELFAHSAITNELDWLLKHFYVSGLDKANNNACFLYIRHIRLQAAQRLMEEDFMPCKTESSWQLLIAVFDSVKTKLATIFLEITPTYQALPFLMATFKQHKGKYRWLTNAFRTVYTNIAALLTVATLAVLEAFKTWAQKTTDGYRNFLRINTSIFWIVDSSLQVTLNLPPKIQDIYVADIARYYESIPLTGNDNLLDALIFVIKRGFQEVALQHPKTHVLLWVRVAWHRGLDGAPTSRKQDTR